MNTSERCPGFETPNTAMSALTRMAVNASRFLNCARAIFCSGGGEKIRSGIQV